MVDFKIVIADPKTNKSYQKEFEQKQSQLLGKKIGDKIKGDGFGLTGGYELQITGGSDNAGFPMRSDVEGTARKRLLITKGVGFRSKKKGMRKRKSIRGNTVSTVISQINMIVVSYGSQPVEKLLGKKEGGKSETKGQDVPKEPVKQEPQKEEGAKPREESKPEEDVKQEEKTE